MRSVQGMFDLIQEVRKETNRPLTRIEPSNLPKIKGIYMRAKTRREFKEELKTYLHWQVFKEVTMKGIYLAAFRARHPNYNIIYQDINPRCKCDLVGDMLDVNLTEYDFIIATPPCNYWSRANYRREVSEYSRKTKHLHA